MCNTETVGDCIACFTCPFCRAGIPLGSLGECRASGGAAFKKILGDSGVSSHVLPPYCTACSVGSPIQLQYVQCPCLHTHCSRSYIEAALPGVGTTR